MFKQLFATMHEVLDEIIEQYPSASPNGKKELDQQLNDLKHMSDIFVEQWLIFEEKMSQFQEGIGTTPPKQKGQNALPPQNAKPITYKEYEYEEFDRGQGYFKLYMFDHAIRELKPLVHRQPEMLLARLYLALSYLQTKDYEESLRHLSIIIPLTEDNKIKAISYNAMGCIQAKKGHLEKALEYFNLSYEADPSMMEPLINMGNCLSEGDSLEYGLNFIH
jgi:tetratricopeptide (TPR) repeat protein